MASDAQICSLALAKLGQLPINSLSQSAPRAEKCNAVYALLRDVELSEHNWDFATKYVLLALVDETPAYGYSYSYQLPSDFLKITRVDDTDLDYRIVGDKLYTNINEIGIEYIRQVTDSGEFSAPFIDLLVARLVKDLSWAMTNSKGMVELAAADYIIIRRKAIGVDSQQGKPRKFYKNKMNDARRL